MHLSVIVITFNRAESLGRVLDSIKTLARPNDLEVEVVVVDNNSRDDTRRVVDQHARDFPFAVRYVFESRQGTNFARNAGVVESRGEIVAFVDDDNTIGRDWLAGLQAAVAAASGASTISGPIVPVFPGVEPGVMPKWVPSHFWGYYGHQDFGPAPTVIAAPRWPHEMNIAIRRSVFEKVGGFGTAIQRVGKKLISNDGFDFVNRVRASGGECTYHPAMLAYHHIPESRATPEYLIRRHYWQAVSDARGDSALAGLSRAELLRRAWKEAPRLMRLASGRHYSLRRIRWHYLKLPLSDRCSIAYRFGILSEQVRLALSPRPYRSYRDDNPATGAHEG